MFPHTLRLITQTAMDKLQACPFTTAVLLCRAYYLQYLQHQQQQTFMRRAGDTFLPKTRTHKVRSSTECTGSYLSQILQMRQNT
jgi:hypothetical protein